jgi:hypothetical protein
LLITDANDTLLSSLSTSREANVVIVDSDDTLSSSATRPQPPINTEVLKANTPITYILRVDAPIITIVNNRAAI